MEIHTNKMALETQFADLLDEQKSKIFAHLPSEERQKIRSVCMGWRNVINEIFGIKIRVKNSTNDLVMTSADAIDVELCSMTIPFKENIAFANRVEHLSFSNIVVTYNVICFLRECKNIKTLTFNSNVIDIPMAEQWNPASNELIPLQNLEVLEIHCWTFTDYVMDLLNFLKDKFSYGNLQQITVVSQNPPILPLHLLFSEESEIVEDNHVLLQLVKVNLETIRKFSVGRITMPTIFKFHEYGIFSSEYPLQIKEMVITPYFREEWVSIFNNQNNLEILDVGSVNVNRWDNIMEGIFRNSATLKSFSMRGLSFGQSWDCSVFQNCFCLDSLAIEICHSPKINFNMIPPQLNSLSVWGPLTIAEMIAIAQNLINLTMLKFSNLGRSASMIVNDDEKVDLSIFKTLLQLPLLKTLCFNVCSSVSVEWGPIATWCRANASQGFRFEQHFYQMHGEEIPDGITITTNDNFQREGIRWTSDENDPLQVNSFNNVALAISSMSFP